MNLNDVPSALPITSSDHYAQIERRISQRLIEAGCVQFIDGETIPIPTATSPVFLPEQTYRRAKQVAEAALRISIKARPFFMTDPTALRYAGYSEHDIDLATWELAHDAGVPVISRIDMILNSQQLSVLEINTDSPAGMFHTDVISDIYAELYDLHSATDIKNGEALPSICHAIRDELKHRQDRFYARLDRGSSSRGNIAILEWDPQTTPARAEQEYFARLLSGTDNMAFNLDPDDLSFHNGLLFDSNSQVPIDLIYRRALWGTLRGTEKHKGANALLEAYRNDAAHVENGLASQMLGSKALMAFIKSPDFQHRIRNSHVSLRDDEKSAIKHHMPDTWFWGEDDDLRARVLACPEKYVIKSCGGFGAHEVMIGSTGDISPEKLNAVWGEGHVAQEYRPHGTIEMALFENAEQRNSIYFILGAYLVDGQCIAIDAKLRDMVPISMSINQAESVSRTHRSRVFPCSA